MQQFSQAGHTIYWGDAIHILQHTIKTASVDLIFVDPPYNIGKNLQIFTINGPATRIMLPGRIPGLTNVFVY